MNKENENGEVVYSFHGFRMNLQAAIGAVESRARQGIERIAHSPILLLATLLFLDALLHPYRGITHDSRLYAFSVQNLLLDGALAGDVYLRFGSQGEHTVLTAIALFLAGFVGLKASFFVLYLCSRVLLIGALARLCARLIDDRALRVLAVFLVISARMPFGGFDLLAVQEPFLTPRPFAFALSLLAIDEALGAGCRRLRIALYLIGAFLIHPLIPSGAALTVLLLLMSGGRSRRLVPLTIGLLALAGGFISLAAALRLIAIETLDPAWRTVVLARSPFYFPTQWPLADWLRIFFASGCVLAAARVADGTRRHLLLTILCAALTGTALSLCGEIAEPAFLVQAQPYRSLWLLAAILLPCAFVLLPAALASGRTLIALGAILGALLLSDSALCPGAAMLLLFVPICLWGVRAASSDGLAAALLISAAVGFILLTIVTLAVEMGGGGVDWLFELARELKLALFALVLIPGIFVFAGSDGRRALTIFAALAIALETLGYAAATTDAYPAGRRQRALLAENLRARLAEKKDIGTPANIYWPGMLDEIWFRLGQRSYFNTFQFAGVVFNRATAMVAAKRAADAAPFERYYYHEWKAHRYAGSFNAIPRMALGMFAPSEDFKRPDFEALAKLCSDPELDLVILDYMPPGSPDGPMQVSENLYMFECKRLAGSTRSSSDS